MGFIAEDKIKDKIKTYCDPELQYQIEQIIAGKRSFRDKAVKLLNSW